MCGITGIYAFNQVGSFYMINLARSIDLLAHRGPDGRGSYIGDLVALGQRRLAIIDAENGRQPMHDLSDRYVIIFNGEIFNYKELRKELSEHTDITFQTESDTEVLLYAYIKWGESCLAKLRGFFAFSIYDKQTHELFIARDRLGVKPLLYYIDEDKLVFSSEMKSILAYNIPKEIDWASVRQFFALGYIPGGNSIFQHIKKLEPGTCMRVNKQARVTKQYYELPSTDKITRTDFSSSAKTVRDLVFKSVEDRLVSDVPVGAFLSGGVDSSVVVATASQLNASIATFSIGYKDEAYFDETSHAELVARQYNTNHTTYTLSKSDLTDHLFHCLDSLDEPFGDSSALPMYVLSKKVAAKCKVVLSGDGADELFGGYNKHKAEWLVKNPDLKVRLAMAAAPFLQGFKGSRNSAFQNNIRQINRMALGMKQTDAERYYTWCSLRTEEEIKELFLPAINHQAEEKLRKKNILRHFSSTYSFNQVLRTDLELVLGGDMLFKVDKMSMAHGLEVREPLIDYRIVEFVSALPPDFKRNKEHGKRLLREAFKEDLPAAIWNKPKQGFEVPLRALFTKELKKWILEELLNRERIEHQKIFNWKYIEQVRESIKNNKPYDEEHIWTLIVFQYWWMKYMNEKH